MKMSVVQVGAHLEENIMSTSYFKMLSYNVLQILHVLLSLDQYCTSIYFQQEYMWNLFYGLEKVHE